MSTPIGSFFRVSLLFLLCVTVPSSLAQATSVRLLSLSEIRDQADTVIVGLVVSVSTRLSPQGKMIWTDYEVVVEETLAGPVRESPTIVSFAGGQYGGRAVTIHGMPQLVVGERYVLFLHPQDDIMTATIGWGQGIFESVDISDKAGGSRTVLLSYDGLPLYLDQDKQLFRGAPVQVQAGKLVSRPLQQSRPPELERAPNPIVYDAEGNVIPQETVKLRRAAAVQEPHFATLDDLRLFLQDAVDEE